LFLAAVPCDDGVRGSAIIWEGDEYFDGVLPPRPPPTTNE
jgi:hypothetical protein